MQTVRPALRELLNMGTVIGFGEVAGDGDGAERHRGAAWLAVQVAAAAAVLGVVLLVRHLLGSGDLLDGPGPLALWVVPALLLVVPFVAHFLARPRRPLVGALTVVATAAALVAPTVAVALAWGPWGVYLGIVLTALAAAVVLGLVSPAVPRADPP